MSPSNPDPYLDGANWTAGAVPHYTGPVTDEMKAIWFPASGSNRAWDRPVGQNSQPTASPNLPALLLQSPAPHQAVVYGPQTKWEDLNRRQLEDACFYRTLGANGTTAELIERLYTFGSSPLAQYHASLMKFERPGLDQHGPQPASTSTKSRSRPLPGPANIRKSTPRPAPPSIDRQTRSQNIGTPVSGPRGRGRPPGTGKHQIAKAKAVAQAKQKAGSEEEEESAFSDAVGNEDDEYVPGPARKKQRKSY